MADVSVRVETSAETRPLAEVSAGLRRMEESLEQVSASSKRAADNSSRMEAVFRHVAVQGLAMLKDFAVGSVNAALENERAMTRLRHVAGEYTDALAQQADSMQVALNVSGEMVMGLQEMALRFEVAPRDVKALTEAVLDYSKATGVDADGAMRRLLMGLENGGAGLARMGLQLNSTGNKAADLTEAVKQLHERWGGAAKADAETLTGKVEGLKLAFGELQETVGKVMLGVGVAFDGFAGKLVGSTSLVKALTASLNELDSGELFKMLSQAGWKMYSGGAYADAAAQRTEALAKAQGRLVELIDKQRKLDALAPINDSFVTANRAKRREQIVDDIFDAQRQVKAAQAAIAKAKGEAAAAQPKSLESAEGPVIGVGYEPSKLKKAAEELEKARKASSDAAEARRKSFNEVLLAEAEGAAQLEAMQQERASEETRRLNEAALEALRIDQETKAELLRAEAAYGEHLEAMRAERAKAEEQANAERLQEQEAATERLRSGALQMAELGMRALSDVVAGLQASKERQASAMAAANERYKADMEEARRYSGEKAEALGRESLERLQKGMRAAAKSAEFDPMDLIKEAIPALVQTALMIAPGTQAIAPLVGSAVRLLVNAFHEGGWVGNQPPGAPRERPALLLDGERVLSHREVSAMGGPASVDAAASGARGGGSTLTLQVATLDAASFRDWLGAEGGAALARALVGNRGEAAQLFRRLARR